MKNIQGKFKKKQQAETQSKAASPSVDGGGALAGDNERMADWFPVEVDDAFAFADDTDVDSDEEEPNA